MATIKLQRPRIELFVTLRLDLAELSALDAITGYGIDNFIKVFKKELGAHYLEKTGCAENADSGIRRLFVTIRDQLPGIYQKVSEIEKVISQE